MSTYNIEDGNDPLAAYLDIDVTKMSPDELSNYLSSLNEATENPKAIKRILERKPRAKSKNKPIDLNAELSKLGLL